MNTQKVINKIGMFVMLAAIILTWVFFGWKLVLVIMLSLWGNNLEQHKQQ